MDNEQKKVMSGEQIRRRLTFLQNADCVIENKVCKYCGEDSELSKTKFIKVNNLAEVLDSIMICETDKRCDIKTSCKTCRMRREIKKEFGLW